MMATSTRTVEQSTTQEEIQTDTTSATPELKPIMNVISRLKGFSKQRHVAPCHGLRNFSMMSDALSGIKVLDLTRVLAGPYCTQILGDLGADVLKIERLQIGDETRNWGPPFVNNVSCYFLSINRNKRSMCINLKSPEGADIIKKLAMQSDILVENYLPGKMDSFGLGFEDLHRLNPKLVYCSISGYGSHGPYASRPGYDVIASSIGGLIHVTGPEEGEPCKTGVALTDLATGLYAHGAIMAALLQRYKTGLGQNINVNLLSTQIACLVNLGANYLLAGQEAKRWGTAHESIVPYQAFKTADGYMTIGGANNRQFTEVCSKMQRQDLVADPKYQSNPLRVKNRKELIQEMSKTLVIKTNAEWNEIFKDASFPFGPINTLAQVFEDPQVKYSGIVQSIEHPSAGSLKLVGPPVQFSGSENRIRLPPPELGQHTKDILSQRLGFSEDEIEKLRKFGVVN